MNDNPKPKRHAVKVLITWVLHFPLIVLAVGEKHVLKVPSSQLIRIRHNPFHAYMNQRMLEAIGERVVDNKK